MKPTNKDIDDELLKLGTLMKKMNDLDRKEDTIRIERIKTQKELSLQKEAVRNLRIEY